MSSPVGVSASLLAADPLIFGDQIRLALEGGADSIHVDIMDGRFVPAISVGPFVVEAIAPLAHASGALVEAHLLVEEPERMVPALALAGADHIILPLEACRDIARTLKGIRIHGAKSGISLRPKTPLLALQASLGLADLVLILSADPGSPGQEFQPESLARIRRVKELLCSMGSSAMLEVEGGVNGETAGSIVAAGATILVAGDSIFRAGKPIADSVRMLRAAVAAG